MVRSAVSPPPLLFELLLLLLLVFAEESAELGVELELAVPLVPGVVPVVSGVAVPCAVPPLPGFVSPVELPTEPGCVWLPEPVVDCVLLGVDWLPVCVPL